MDIMILTYKVKHDRDFSREMRMAKKVAAFAIMTGSRTTKDVKAYRPKVGHSKSDPEKVRKRQGTQGVAR